MTTPTPNAPDAFTQWARRLGEALSFAESPSANLTDAPPGGSWDERATFLLRTCKRVGLDPSTAKPWEGIAERFHHFKGHAAGAYPRLRERRGWRPPFGTPVGFQLPEEIMNEAVRARRESEQFVPTRAGEPGCRRRHRTVVPVTLEQVPDDPAREARDQLHFDTPWRGVRQAALPGPRAAV
jgi:hypothetical protein